MAGRRAPRRGWPSVLLPARLRLPPAEPSWVGGVAAGRGAERRAPVRGHEQSRVAVRWPDAEVFGPERAPRRRLRSSAERPAGGRTAERMGMARMPSAGRPAETKAPRLAQVEPRLGGRRLRRGGRL